MAHTLTFRAEAIHPDTRAMRTGWIDPRNPRDIHTAEDEDLSCKMHFTDREKAVEFARDFLGQYTEQDFSGVYTLFQSEEPEYVLSTGENVSFTVYLESD